MDKVRGWFDFDVEQGVTSPNNNDELDGCLPQLTFKERMLGFCTCFGLGLIIDLLSFGSFVGLLTGNPSRFALTYTFGNILSIIGICFLIGPKKQFKQMFDKKRWICATIYVVSIALTLCAVLWWDMPILMLIFVLIQYCAFIWYVASYIPLARTCIKNCLKKCCRFS